MKNTSTSLAQKTADEIYDMIIKEHTFNPGDKLPNENELSDSLGISRATLREAIRILSLQGILEVMRGKGTFVTNDAALFDDYGMGNFDRIRVRLKDLYELRLIFEPQVAALACRRATQEEINKICIQGEEVAKIICEGKDRTEADKEFHKLIVMASHNDFMIRFIPMINKAVSESIYLNSNSKILAEDTLRDHALIMEFLQKHDELGTKYAMEIHIHHAIHNLNLNNGEDPLYI